MGKEFKYFLYIFAIIAISVSIYFLNSCYSKKEKFYYPIDSEKCLEEMEEYGKPMKNPILDIGKGESNDKISSRQFEKAFPYSEESVIPMV